MRSTAEAVVVDRILVLEVDSLRTGSGMLLDGMVGQIESDMVLEQEGGKEQVERCRAVEERCRLRTEKHREVASTACVSSLIRRTWPRVNVVATMRGHLGAWWHDCCLERE